MYELPQELPHDLRLRNLENQNLVKKSLKRLELTVRSTQPATQKVNYKKSQKSPVKHSIEKLIFFNFLNFSTVFCLNLGIGDQDIEVLRLVQLPMLSTYAVSAEMLRFVDNIERKWKLEGIIFHFLAKFMQKLSKCENLLENLSIYCKKDLTEKVRNRLSKGIS